MLRRLGCDELPEPEIDVAAFIAQVNAALAQTQPVYNPLTGRTTPWIDTRALQRFCSRAGGGGGTRPAPPDSGGCCVVA
jgi:hypothetical protein